MPWGRRLPEGARLPGGPSGPGGLRPGWTQAGSCLEQGRAVGWTMSQRGLPRLECRKFWDTGGFGHPQPPGPPGLALSRGDTVIPHGPPPMQGGQWRGEPSVVPGAVGVPGQRGAAVPLPAGHGA